MDFLTAGACGIAHSTRDARLDHCGAVNARDDR